MNRRSFIKKSVGSMLTVAGLGSGAFYYAKRVEPDKLNVVNEKIASQHVPPSFQDFKIIQFSDTHVGFHYSVEQLKELIEKMNTLNPDILVFTGDLVDDPKHFHTYDVLTEVLSISKATYGKFWVYGNHDHGGYGTDIINEVMERSGFTLLQNSHAVIEKETDRIVLAGVDDVILGKPNVEAALKHVNPDLFTVLLVHEPDIATNTSKFPVDVQLSGHSHGGQIRLPLIGDLYTPAYAEKFIKGKYTLNDRPFRLYVNSGIGTTRLPYRFFCPPEIHVYTLNAKS